MKRVLVVDDDAGARAALSLMLSLEGYDVATAADAAEAITRAAHDPPDIVLCDLGLGSGGDGCAVARAIRGVPALAATRLLALTGTETREVRDLASAAGFEAYLVKPVAPAALLAALAGTGGA